MRRGESAVSVGDVVKFLRHPDRTQRKERFAVVARQRDASLVVVNQEGERFRCTVKQQLDMDVRVVEKGPVNQ